MDKEETIKSLMQSGIVQEQIRYDVSTLISYDPKKAAEAMKELNLTEDEFHEWLREYSSKRKIFFFATMKKPWEELEFKIGDDIIRHK